MKTNSIISKPQKKTTILPLYLTLYLTLYRILYRTVYRTVYLTTKSIYAQVRPTGLSLGIAFCLLCLLTLFLFPARGSALFAQTTSQTSQAAVPNVVLAGNVGCDNLLLNGDAEATDGWRFGPTAAAGSYTADPIHKGAGAIRLGVPPGAANVFAHSTAYQTIAIPADAEAVTLSYWERPGGTGDGNDYREILLLRTNFTVLQILNRDRLTGNDQWAERTYDLTSYRGQSVVLYFNVYNDGAVSPLWNYVDDVRLRPCNATPDPTDIPSTETPTDNPTANPTANPTVENSPTATATATLLPTSTATPEATRIVNGPTFFVENVAVDLSVGLTQSFTTSVVMSGLGTGVNVGSFNLDLTYDATKVTVTGCEPVGTFDIALCNTNVVGRVRMAGVDSEGVTAETESERILMAELSLTLLKTDFDTTTLTMSSDEVGTSQGVPLTVTAQNGTVTLTQSCPSGDVNCDGAMGTTDALFILQYDVGSRVGSTTAPPAADALFLPACDLNADSRCDLSDALVVLQCLIGQSNNFCPEGDPPTSQGEFGSEGDGSIVIYIEELPEVFIGIYEASIYADIPVGMSGATIDVRYDPTQLMLESCTPNTGNFEMLGFDAGVCNMAYDIDRLGLDGVRLNIISSGELSGVVTLAKLGFSRVEGATGQLTPVVFPQYAIDALGTDTPTEPPSERGGSTIKLYLPAFVQ